MQRQKVGALRVATIVTKAGRRTSSKAPKDCLASVFSSSNSEGSTTKSLSNSYTFISFSSSSTHPISLTYKGKMLVVDLEEGTFSDRPRGAWHRCMSWQLNNGIFIEHNFPKYFFLRQCLVCRVLFDEEQGNFFDFNGRKRQIDVYTHAVTDCIPSGSFLWHRQNHQQCCLLVDGCL